MNAPGLTLGIRHDGHGIAVLGVQLPDAVNDGGVPRLRMQIKQPHINPHDRIMVMHPEERMP